MVVRPPKVAETGGAVRCCHWGDSLLIFHLIRYHIIGGYINARSKPTVGQFNLAEKIIKNLKKNNITDLLRCNENSKSSCNSGVGRKTIGWGGFVTE